MALIGSMTKQPREVLPVDISYTGVIANRTVSVMSPTIEAPTGITIVTNEVIGDKLQIYISGGTTGQAYKITILMSLTIGGHVTTVEDEFNVLVEEL